MIAGSLLERICYTAGSRSLQREEWQKAARWLTRVNQSNPTHRDAHTSLAIALLKLERWEEAAGIALRAIDIDPQSSDAHAFFGIALLKMERWDEAVAAYHRAIAVAPDRVDNYERLGMALTHLGRWSEVVDALRPATALAPDNRSLHTSLGVALLATGRHADAATAFERALDLAAPDSAPADERAQLVMNLFRATAPLPASAETVEALRRRESTVSTLIRLGVDLCKLEQWEEADTVLRRTAELAPDVGASEFLRVDPLIRLGRLVEAVEAHRCAAAALAYPPPPLPGEPAAARFERRRESFWSPDNLGPEVFATEQWLESLNEPRTDPSRRGEPSGSPDVRRPAADLPRLLFILDNDYGELTTLKYLLLGQSIARQSTVLLPDRLYRHNPQAVPGRTHRYASLDDIMAMVDREQPGIVCLCSGYLLSAHQILDAETLERLLQLLRDRGCRIVTTDPFLGMLSRQDPRTLIRFDVPETHPVMSADHLASAKRRDEEVMWTFLGRAEKTVRGAYHLYPAYCALAPEEAGPTDARNLSFFNDRLLRPSALTSQLPDPERPAPTQRPHWLFILADADYDAQLLFEGSTAFADIVAAKLLETLAAGRHPILIASKAFVEHLETRMPTTEGIDLLTFCPFRRFMSLLLSAEHAFYWNVLSHSLLLRLFNGLPVVVFDRGHLVRSARNVSDRVVRWYYQGWQPTIRDHRAVLTLETVSAWTEDYRRQAGAIAERFTRAPRPEQMIRDLATGPVAPRLDRRPAP